jgi:hypothetical protein
MITAPNNDALAVATAVDGSLRPTRFIDPSLIRCSATYYVGSDDWIHTDVRHDVDALGATLDVIPGTFWDVLRSGTAGPHRSDRASRRE